LATFAIMAINVVVIMLAIPNPWGIRSSQRWSSDVLKLHKETDTLATIPSDTETKVKEYSFPVLRIIHPANILPLERAIECGNRRSPASVDELNRTAEKYNGTLYNIENAVMLAKKLASETARGVRCLMSRIGITGYAATLVST